MSILEQDRDAIPERSNARRSRRRWLRLLAAVGVVAWNEFWGSVPIPYKLTLEVTRECNCPCQFHCQMWKVAKDPNELKTQEVIRSVTSLGGNLLWLNITGGEPTLRKDLPEIVSACVSACANLFVINMPVNGRNPDDTAKMIEKLASQNPEVTFQITVSIDGLGRLQDEIRGKGQSERTEEVWVRLMEISRRYSNLRLSAQSTISTKNQHQAIDLLSTYWAKSENYVVAVAAKFDHYASKKSDFEITLEHPDAMRVLEQLARSYPFHLTKPGTIFQKLSLLGHLHRLRHGPAHIKCSAASATITLKANGMLSPCLFKGEDDIGNVRNNDYDIRRMLRTASARRTRIAVASCNKCWINCESVPSMMMSPVRTLSLFLPVLRNHVVDHNRTSQCQER